MKIYNRVLTLIFVALNLSFTSCNKGLIVKKQPAFDDVILEMNKRVTSIDNFKYSGIHKVKYFTSDDTLVIKGNVRLYKTEADTLLGYKVDIDAPDYSYTYLSKTFYITKKKEQTVMVLNPKTDLDFLSNNVNNDIIYKGLLKPYSLERAKSRNAKMELMDLKGEWLLTISFPAKGETTKNEIKIWLDKQTYLPKKEVFTLIAEGMEQYIETIIENLVINDYSIQAYFDNFKLPEDYILEYYVPEKADYKLLSNGTKAPPFAGANLTNNISALEDFKGKVVLLDFWFLSCYPCLQAMPKLEELFKAYQSQGFVVLGVNSHDKIQRREKLNDYLQNKNITYPNVLVNKDVDSLYLVKTYPTMYLLDRNGAVILSKIGYNEKHFDEIESVIKQALEAPVN